MNLAKQVQDLTDQLKSLKGFAESQEKFHAVVEDVDDPEKEGRVKVRVAGVHPASKADLSTEKLPWQKVVLPAGSSGGIGDSINLLVGQWVEVEAATPGASSFKVTRSVAASPSSDSGDEAYGNVAEGDDNKIGKSIVPNLSTGDALKLGGTIYGLVNSELLKFTTNPDDGTTPGTPALPIPAFDITANDVDWSLKEVSRYGADLGSFEDFIKVDGHPPRDDTQIELISEGANDSPGNIVGFEQDGTKSYPTYTDRNLRIPPVVTPDGYIIKYRVSEIGNLTNFAEAEITINVTDEPIVIPRVITPRAYAGIPDITQPIQDHSIEEPESTSNKAEYPNAVIKQGHSNAWTEEKDSTKGNRRYAVTHMADEDNPASISRIEMNNAGDMITKSATDMYLISKKNLLQYVENAVEQTIGSYLSINAPSILLKGNIRIEGNMNITGNITHLGDVTQDGTQTTTGLINSDTEVQAKTILLTSHVHKESGGTDSGLSTTAPVE